jgi:phospholipase/lecithinase/hemolysin
MIAVEQQQHPDAKILTVNVYAKWNHVLANARNYGIAYPFAAGMDDPDFISTNDFSIGDPYGSWDGLHPTTTIHRLIAEWFKRALGQ